MLFHPIARHKPRRALAALVVACLIVFVAFVPTAHAKDNIRRLEVSGSQDRTDTKARKALDEAFRNAVAEIVRQYSDPAGLEAQKAQIDEKLLDNAPLYIRNYQVTDEKTTGNLTTVKVSADVWVDPILRDLKSLGILKVSEAPQQQQRVVLTVAQPDHYRKVVVFRKMLQEEMEGVDSVQTTLLSKDQVELTLVLNDQGNPEKIMTQLQNWRVEGQPLKLSRAGNDHVDVRF